MSENGSLSALEVLEKANAHLETTPNHRQVNHDAKFTTDEGLTATFSNRETWFINSREPRFDSYVFLRNPQETEGVLFSLEARSVGQAALAEPRGLTSEWYLLGDFRDAFKDINEQVAEYLAHLIQLFRDSENTVAMRDTLISSHASIIKDAGFKMERRTMFRKTETEFIKAESHSIDGEPFEDKASLLFGEDYKLKLSASPRGAEALFVLQGLLADDTLETFMETADFDARIAELGGQNGGGNISDMRALIEAERAIGLRAFSPTIVREIANRIHLLALPHDHPDLEQ